VDRVYGGRRMGAEPLSCGAHGERWRALIGQGDVAGSLGFHRLAVHRHLPTAWSTKEETERSDRGRGREGRRESEPGKAERERLPSVLVAAAEGILSFSRNKSRETEGVGRRWSLLSAARGGKQGRAGQRQRAVQGKGERSRGEWWQRRSSSGQRGNGGWKQRQGKRKGELPVVRCEQRQRRAPEGDLRLLEFGSNQI